MPKASNFCTDRRDEKNFLKKQPAAESTEVKTEPKNRLEINLWAQMAASKERLA